jgi:hypothetical protein
MLVVSKLRREEEEDAEEGEYMYTPPSAPRVKSPPPPPPLSMTAAAHDSHHDLGSTLQAMFLQTLAQSAGNPMLEDAAVREAVEKYRQSAAHRLAEAAVEAPHEYHVIPAGRPQPALPQDGPFAKPERPQRPRAQIASSVALARSRMDADAPPPLPDRTHALRAQTLQADVIGSPPHRAPPLPPTQPSPVPPRAGRPQRAVPQPEVMERVAASVSAELARIRGSLERLQID